MHALAAQFAAGEGWRPVPRADGFFFSVAERGDWGREPSHPGGQVAVQDELSLMKLYADETRERSSSPLRPARPSHERAGLREDALTALALQESCLASQLDCYHGNAGASHLGHAIRCNPPLSNINTPAASDALFSHAMSLQFQKVSSDLTCFVARNRNWQIRRRVPKLMRGETHQSLFWVGGVDGLFDLRGQASSRYLVDSSDAVKTRSSLMNQTACILTFFSVAWIQDSHFRHHVPSGTDWGNQIRA